MKLRLIDLVWLLLLAATATTWWLDASGKLDTPAHTPVVWLIFGLAWLKGLGVILEFMELRHAPALWRNALLALFTLMVALILLAWAVA
ncbi:hypothetical protein ADJ79_03490 [Ottowia sp. oral taxon 894]|jgi:hypothetical protein|uniref:cytochrome C oxidase subunit IV family protein n=1 Tax=Ottowia TaxID=219181 RepID=UPI000680B8E5|nr:MULTISPECIES: cytochrome C oxidase subunit IV family protein [Ottowia]AKU66530.1 hypothetical protein ADJ79_03490 [Ottowia sp. oral taxon 894]